MSKYLGRIAPSAVFSKLFSGFLTAPVPVLEDRGYKSSEADASSEQSCYLLAVRGRRRC